MNYIKSESKKKVMGVSNLCQYQINNNYITLFGEFHSTVPLFFDTKIGIGLDEFVLDRVKKNKKYENYQVK